jgi:hypothetical protein
LVGWEIGLSRSRVRLNLLNFEDDEAGVNVVRLHFGVLGFNEGKVALVSKAVACVNKVTEGVCNEGVAWLPEVE